MLPSRPAENFQMSEAQTPFNFLGQKESTCQNQNLAHFGVPPDQQSLAFFGSLYLRFRTSRSRLKSLSRVRD